MIGTTNDGWKWCIIWLAFASLLEVPPPQTVETSRNPLRVNATTEQQTPIRRVARAVIDLGEALVGVIK
jgi:hypothetical protein